MGRHRKPTRPTLTTINIAVESALKLNSLKRRRENQTDCINRILIEYGEHIRGCKMLEEWNENQNKALEKWKQEAKRLKEKFESDEYLRDKYSQELERLTLIIEKGPLQLEMLEKEQLKQINSII
jgi:hypothetical protein